MTQDPIIDPIIDEMLAEGAVKPAPDPVQVLHPEPWGDLVILSAGDGESSRIVGRLAGERSDVRFHALAQGNLSTLRALLAERHYRRREGKIQGDPASPPVRGPANMEIHMRGGRA